MHDLQSAQSKLNGSKSEQLAFRKDPIRYLESLGIPLKGASEVHARTNVMTNEAPTPDWRSNIMAGDHDAC